MGGRLAPHKPQKVDMEAILAAVVVCLVVGYAGWLIRDKKK